jgi:hypothetical protein
VGITFQEAGGHQPGSDLRLLASADFDLAVGAWPEPQKKSVADGQGSFGRAIALFAESGVVCAMFFAEWQLRASGT